MSNAVNDKPGDTRADSDAHRRIGEALLEIGSILDQIERATTHYQVLGVERTSNRDQITTAYREAVTVLGRASNDLAGLVPPDQLAKIKAALGRAGQAFTVLNSIGKRADYDNWLRNRAGRPATELPLGSEADESSARESSSRNGHPDVASGTPAIQHTESTYQGRVYGNLPGGNRGEERRRCSRLTIGIPGRVTGFSKEGEKWNEMIRTVDVSRMGACLVMKERPKVGQVLHLTLPLPAKLRTHGYTEPSYHTYALVHRVEPMRSDSRAVGVEFLGLRPPAEYIDSPWSVFRAAEWRGPDRRRAARINRAEPLELQYLSPSLDLLGTSSARSENIGALGARICLSDAVPDFEFLRVSSSSAGFESLALVCNRYRGSDGRLRLCVRFLDQEWPGMASRLWS
jgi:hypothetical protein